MKNASLMSVMNRLGHRLQTGGRAGGGPRTIPQPVGQGLAAHIVHREKMLAFVNANFMNGDDVGMSQLGGGLGFGSESADRFVRRQRAKRDHLDGNDSVQTGLAGPINDAHATAANLLQQLVVTEPRRIWRPRWT